MIEDRITMIVWASSTYFIPLGALIFAWPVENEMPYWICIVDYLIASLWFGASDSCQFYLFDSLNTR